MIVYHAVYNSIRECIIVGPSSSLTSDNIIVCLCSCCVRVLVFMLHMRACVNAVYVCLCSCYRVRNYIASPEVEIVLDPWNDVPRKCNLTESFSSACSRK